MPVNRKRLRRIAVAVPLAGMIAASGAARAAAPAGTVPAGTVRVGSAAALPAGARRMGTLPTATRLNLTIALRPRDPSGLRAEAAAVATPGSPRYRRYLTVAQFTERFGAGSAAVAAVQSALRAQGLDVGPAAANQLTIPVTGTAAQVQRAFSVSLAQVRLAGGRVAYANTAAPTLPAGVARDVQGVVGLDDLTPARPAGLSRGRAHPGAAGVVRPSVIAGASRATVGGRAPATVAGGAHANVVTGGPQPCQAAVDAAASGGYTADSSPRRMTSPASTEPVISERVRRSGCTSSSPTRRTTSPPIRRATAPTPRSPTCPSTASATPVRGAGRPSSTSSR